MINDTLLQFSVGDLVLELVDEHHVLFSEKIDHLVEVELPNLDPVLHLALDLVELDRVASEVFLDNVGWVSVLTRDISFAGTLIALDQIGQVTYLVALGHITYRRHLHVLVSAAVVLIPRFLLSLHGRKQIRDHLIVLLLVVILLMFSALGSVVVLESDGCEVDEEVVHDIPSIPEQWQAVRTLELSGHVLLLLVFVLSLLVGVSSVEIAGIIRRLLIVDDLLAQHSEVDLSQHDVDEVVRLDVLQHCSDDVEFAEVQLRVAGRARN